MTEEKNETQFFKLLLKFETSFTPNAFILYFATLLKLLGLINITHSLDFISFPDRLESIQNYYNKLTLYSKDNSHAILNEYKYDALLIAIYILTPLPWIILYFIYRSHISSSYKPTMTTKLLLKFSSLLHKVIFFFSQHILEALALLIFSLINETYLKTDYEVNKTNLLNSNRKYFYLVMNTLYIIGINISSYWQIALMNQPFFSTRKTIQIFHNKWFKMILCFLFNCQGIGIVLILDPWNFLLKLIVNNIFTAVLIMFYFSYVHSFFSNQTVLSKVFTIIINMCFVSSLLEIYVYLVKENGMVLIEFIEKILIELLFAIMINQAYCYLKGRRLKSSLRRILFSHQKSVLIDPFLYCATVLRQSIDDNSLIYDLLLIIEDHKKECKDLTCQCSKTENKIRYEKLINIKTEVKTKLTIEQFYWVYKEIIICFENEISKMLETITKMNKLLRYCQVIILQIEYIFYFSQNVFFACFMIEKYLKKIKKPPFILKYQMFQLKQQAIQSYKAKLFENLYRYEKTNSKEMMVFSHFFKYQQVIIAVRRNLNQLASEYLNVFSLKYLKNSLSASSLCNIKNIIKSCERFDKENKELQCSIVRNFSFSSKLSNEEMCYLLILYFTTICNKVPKYIQECITKDYTSITSIQHLNQSYNEKGMTHPIIVFVEEGKKFVIRYMCKYLMAHLGYETNELIGREINELLPKAFEEAHLTSVSNTVLKKKPRFLESSVFCIDKRGYYVPIDISVGFFPTIDNNIIIVINAVKRNYSDNYSFIVIDEYGTFLSYSKEIESNFIINKDIINKVKLNFFSYFNMPETIIDPLKRSLVKIREKRRKKEAITRNAMTKYENDEKTNRELKEISDLNFIYDKQKLKVSLEKIKNWIKESQTDLSLLSQIEKQERHFDLYQSTTNFKDPHELIAKCRKQLLGMQIKLSSINKTIFFYVTLFDIDKSSKDFIHKTMSNCSVLFSNYKKDDVNGSRGGGGIKRPFGNKYSQKSLNAYSSANNKNPQMSIISKLLRNPQSYSSSKQINNINNNNNSSIHNSTNQSNLNFSVSFNKNLITKEDTNTSTKTNNNNSKKKRSSIVMSNNKKTTSKMKLRLMNFENSNCHKSNVFKVIILFDLFIIAVFSVIFYPMNLISINAIENYSLLGSSNELLQYLLSASSLLAINNCLVFPHMTKDPAKVIDYEEMKLSLQKKSYEFLIYLNIFHSSITTLNEFKLIDVGVIEFNILKINWGITPRNSTLIEELLSFHYYLHTESRSESHLTQCHLDAFKFKQFAKEPNDLSYKPTNDDMFIYYIIENVLYKLIPQIISVYSNIHSKTSFMLDSFKLANIIYTISFSAFFIIIVAVLYCLFNFLMNRNLDMTEKLLSEKNDIGIMTRLVMFKAIMTEFKCSRCEEYEKHLKETSSRWRTRAKTESETTFIENEVIALLNNPSNGKGYSLIASNQGVPIKTNAMMSTMNNFSTNEVMNENAIDNDEDNHNNNNNNRNIDSNPHLIRNKRKEKRLTLHIDNNDSIKSNDSQEDIISLLHKNDKFTLAFRLFISFFVILNIGVLTLFLFMNLCQASNFNKSNSISSNHIAVINEYNYLTLLYLSNVIYFDPYMSQIPEDSFVSLILNNWYNVNPDINNSIYHELRRTLYSASLYLLEIARESVSIFFSNELTLMKELRALDLVVDSRDFCLLNGYYYSELEYNDNNDHLLSELFELSSKCARSCRLIGNNMNKNGLHTSLSTYLLELNSVYKEFVSDYKAGNENKLDSYLFFSKPLLDSMINTMFQGDKAQMVLISTIRKEIRAIFRNWRKLEGDFIVAFIFFDILFSFVSLWFFIKLSNDYVVLYKTVTTISVSIR